MTKPVPEPPDDQKQFGAWLRELRERAGISQVDVGAHAGLSERQVIRWEKEGHSTALALVLYLEAVGVRFHPAPPVGQRMNQAADRIEQAVTVLEQTLARTDGSLAESQPPREAT